MRHFRQIVLADKYVDLPDSSKDNLSDYTKELLQSFEGGSFDRNKTVVAYLMDNYIGLEPEKIEGFDDYRVYRMYAWNGLYLMNPQEKDARLGGAQLTNMITMQCLGSRQATKETKEFIKSHQEYLLKELQDTESKEYIEIAQEFLKLFDQKYMSAPVDAILKMANDFDRQPPEQMQGEELEEFQDNQKVYIAALGFLMKHKSVEERKILYDKAKENKFRFLKGMTEQSLILDPKFIESLGAGMKF